MSTMHGHMNIETDHVSRGYSVAAVLYLQFVPTVMLLRMLNIFCTFTLVLSQVGVHCPIRLCFLLVS
jgi:hypothetical protein